MIRRFIEYLKEVRVEMTKVTWPPRDELINSTTVVVIVSLVFSIFIFAADRVLNFLIGLILDMS